jgi:hypothetical protein
MANQADPAVQVKHDFRIIAVGVAVTAVLCITLLCLP